MSPDGGMVMVILNEINFILNEIDEHSVKE